MGDFGYAPMNLLPHLKFLTSESYTSALHLSFVDGPIQVFDVKAFAPSTTHINGWGTIIVAGMRLGGGEYANVDPDADPNTNNSFSTRSAYVVLDVTDPTQPPQVIAEITDENMGFSFSQPDIAVRYNAAANERDWYLVFGSGPTDAQTVTSDQNPYLYAYKLDYDDRGFAAGFDGTDDITDGNPGFNGDTVSSTDTIGSFIGDIQSQDWNRDYNDDTIYFGTVGGTLEDSTGGIHRYVESTNSVETLLEADAAIWSRPHIRSYAGKRWVFGGTGRFFAPDDSKTTEQNTFYGLIEPFDTTAGGFTWGEIDETSLADVSNVNVTTDGELTPQVNGIDNFADFRRDMIQNGTGWKYDFESTGADPSNKNSASALSFRNFLFFTRYQPPPFEFQDENECRAYLGDSYLNAVDMVTGTAYYQQDFDGILGETNGVLNRESYLGVGYAYQSYLFVGRDYETGKRGIIIKSPLSTGAIKDTKLALPPSKSGRTSWREIEIQ